MVVDGHCDALLKIWQCDEDFKRGKTLQVDLEKWRESPVKIQCFAIFVPPEVPQDEQFDVALKMAELFHREIVEPNSDIKFISTKEDLLSLKEHERGAILTLEGCHVIGKDIAKLKQLINLGVRAVGLTWNHANAVCDGIGEKRGAGLTQFGEAVVDLLNEEQIWTDLSHISVKGFFDTIKRAKYIMASHSNALSIYPHRRNLSDQQIEALIEKDAWMGVTFVPYFTSGKSKVEIADLIDHIQYFLEQGAENCLGFGSDFDGISETINGLANIENYHNLIAELRKHFTKTQIDKMASLNFIEKFPRLHH